MLCQVMIAQSLHVEARPGACAHRRFVLLCGKRCTQLAFLFMVLLNRRLTVQRANDLSDGVCVDLAQCFG